MKRALILSLALCAIAEAQFLKQSTAVTIKYGPMVSVTDGVTKLTSLTDDADHVLLSTNGGALTAKNSTTDQVHDASGYWNVHLDATDTGTCGLLTVVWPDPNALDIPQTYTVLTATAYDALMSTGTFPVNVVEWDDEAVATPDTAGYPVVTVKTGTGSGELDVTAGIIQADVALLLTDDTALQNLAYVFDTAYATAYDDTNDVWNSRVVTISVGAGVASVDDVQTQAELAIDAKLDSIGDKVWLNEPNSTILAAVQAVTDKLDTGLELDGAVYRFTANALEEGPVPESSTDWTSGEAQQIRSALGIDGTKTTATGGQLQDVRTVTNRLNTTIEASGEVYRFTGTALQQAPSSTGSGLTQLGRDTAQGGTATSITLAAGASAINNIYRGARVVLHTGLGAGQTNLIVAYNGTTKVASCLLPWIVIPDATSQYELQAAEGEMIRMLGGLW